MVFMKQVHTWSMLVSTALIWSIASAASAAVLVEDATLVAKSARYAQVAPQPRTLAVSAAGRYRVTLSDVGFPGPLTSLELIITRGTVTVARVLQAGTQEFDATPGNYTVHVLGSGAGPGTASVLIASAVGGTPLLEYQTGIVGNPAAGAPNRTTLAEKFSTKAAGTYQVTLSDRQFPAALASIDLLVVNASGIPVARLCRPSIPSVCASAPVSFTGAVAEYDLFVNATAASPLQAGLYSVNISGGPMSATLYAATHPVGVLESHAYLEFPAATQYALTLNDLNFPAALSTVSAVITQGSELLASASGVSTQSFTALEGQATLYTMASPATAQGVGSFGVHVPSGTQTIYSDAKAVVGTTANGARAYAFVGTFPSAGQYRIQARDFAFPTSIPALQLLVTQNGAPLGAVTAGGSLTVQASAGQFMIVAIANMLSSTATGLFGVTVDAQPSGAEILTVAQGVGDLFHSRSLSVAAAGNLDVTLSDIGFPAPFEDLALVVTRGNTLAGQIFGGGAFSFAATPGTYALNFVARNRATESYGLYGLKVEDSPPPPIVNFTANSGSVPPQGTATVSWSTVGAISCVASGGWSGTRATSGTNVSVGPFATDTTLTLTCTGPGGTRSADTRIVVAAATDDGGGGGSASVWQLLGLTLLLFMRSAVNLNKRVSR